MASEGTPEKRLRGSLGTTVAVCRYDKRRAITRCRQFPHIRAVTLISSVSLRNRGVFRVSIEIEQQSRGDLPLPGARSTRRFLPRLQHLDCSLRRPDLHL